MPDRCFLFGSFPQDAKLPDGERLVTVCPVRAATCLGLAAVNVGSDTFDLDSSLTDGGLLPGKQYRYACMMLDSSDQLSKHHSCCLYDPQI